MQNPGSFTIPYTIGNYESLQMANKSLAQPKGALKDVLIKVGKFIFLVDFVVIDIEEDKQVPLLLGLSWLLEQP